MAYSYKGSISFGFVYIPVTLHKSIKNNDIGFSDYINQSKIEAAKKMMNGGDYKIYEISDRLGFESAFYFSRVFKKVTGLSPRDYMNQNPQP